jgi:sarcosine oxidase
MRDGSYDAIVVGLGGMGSAAAFELARRGARVLGLEQFARGHDRGSSHGLTRIIRKAYYEHPDYVPLVCRAYEGWYDLEQRAGKRLLTECPVLSLGPADSRLLSGVRQSAEQHRLPVEHLSAAERRQRFPAFRFGEEVVGVLERSAGFLAVEECVLAHQEEALRLGATLRDQEPVLSWEASEAGVSVRTAVGTYRADRLVLAAGPWAGQLLAGLGVPLTVMRQVALWFAVREPALFRRDVFPLFIAEVPGGHFYGFPALDGHGLKVAQHYGAPELPGPEGIERDVGPADEAPVRAFLRQHLPDADGALRRGSVCIYTLTPDRHFVIDVHPDHPNVVFAAGFSGHGFKFAPVVGEVLADLALTGQTRWPAGMFRVGRFDQERRPGRVKEAR